MNSKLIAGLFIISSIFGLSVSQSALNCVQCDSGSDVNCLSAPDSITGTPCPPSAHNGTCFSRIVDGRVVRGCYGQLQDSEQSQCTSDNYCSKCVINSSFKPCNDAVFPDHRIRCHQCNGNSESSCARAQNDGPTMCNKFVANETCFIKREENNQVTRGCLSDNIDCASKGKCYVCSVLGCNSLAFNNTEVPTFKNTASTQVCSLLLAVAGLLFISFNNI